MMFPLQKEKIARRGICRYGGNGEYGVVIAESDVLYGTGDHEDPPEIAEDKRCVCYYIWCDSPATRNEFKSGAGVFLYAEESIRFVESWPNFERWDI